MRGLTRKSIRLKKNRSLGPWARLNHMNFRFSTDIHIHIHSYRQHTFSNIESFSTTFLTKYNSISFRFNTHRCGTSFLIVDNKQFIYNTSLGSRVAKSFAFDAVVLEFESRSVQRLFLFFKKRQSKTFIPRANHKYYISRDYNY